MLVYSLWRLNGKQNWVSFIIWALNLPIQVSNRSLESLAIRSNPFAFILINLNFSDSRTFWSYDALFSRKELFLEKSSENLFFSPTAKIYWVPHLSDLISSPFMPRLWTICSIPVSETSSLAMRFPGRGKNLEFCTKIWVDVLRQSLAARLQIA